MGRDIVFGFDDDFPHPAVGDERTILRSRMIETGDVVTLRCQRGLPGLEVVAEEDGRSFKRVSRYLLERFRSNGIGRNRRVVRENQTVVSDVRIRQLPPAGTDVSA